MKSGGKVLTRIVLFLNNLHSSTLGWLYFVHLKVRYLHDLTYSNKKWYKKYHDFKYTDKIHRAVGSAFIISLCFFTVSQIVFPYYLSPKGRPAEGISIQFEEPKTRELTYSQWKKTRSTMRNVVPNADGTVTASVYNKAVQYMDDDGNWYDIDTNIENDGENKLKVVKAPYKAYFTSDSSDDLEILYEGNEIINAFVGAEDNGVKKEDSKITYLDAYPQTDIERIFKNEEVKQNIILKDVGHPTIFKEKISSKLDIRVVNGNSLAYYSGQKKVATTPPITLIDANGIELKLDLKLEEDILTISLPNTRYLSYPFVIDPTTSVYATSSDDTYVVRSNDGYGNYSYYNYYTNQYVYIGDSANYKGYFRFSLSGILGTVSSANLYLYSQSITQSQNVYHSNSFTPTDASTTLWSTGVSNLIASKSFIANSYTETTVTTDVQEMINAGSSYAYFQVYGGSSGIYFRSADYTGTTYDPYLSITYTPPPNAPTGFTGTALSTSSVRWNWTDASTDETGFRVHDGSNVNKSGDLAAGTTQWTESSLVANTQYTRHAHAFSANGESAQSNVVSKYTLPVTPSVTEATGKIPGGAFNQSQTLSFVNSVPFGAGGVQYYRYVWDKNATRTWNDTETQWTYGSITTSASSQGNYYLHLKSYNGDNVAGTTLDYGPFIFDFTAPTGTILIKGGDTYTTSTSVDLTLSASDTGGSNTVSQMRFSNDKVNWSDWETYATAKNGWVIPSGDGVKQVYVQYKDGVGNVSSTTDIAGMWKMDETSGITVSDSSVKNNTGYFRDTNLDNMDATTGWSANTGNSLSLNTTTKKEGTGSINAIKTSTAGSEVYIEKIITATNMSNRYVNTWLYIKDSATLAKAGTTGAEIFIAKSDYTWYIQKGFSNSSLAVGWNLLTFDTANPGATVGTPDLNNVTKIRIDFNTSSTSQTLVAGDIIIDDWFMSDKRIVDGHSGKALSFDGSNDYVYIPDNPSLNPSSALTIEAWIYPTGTPSVEQTILTKGSGTGFNEVSYRIVRLVDNKIKFLTIIGGMEYSLQSTNPISINNWHHIAVTYSSDLKLFVDGTVTSTPSGAVTSSGDPLIIGKNGTDNTNYYQGYIDELRIATVELSESQITADYENGYYETITAISDDIILDTTPPSSITNLKAYTPGKALELVSGTWYGYDTPYFEWNANTEPDLAGYKYCFDINVNCSPTNTLNSANWTVNPNLTISGDYFMRVVAYDLAGLSSTNPISFNYHFDNEVPGAVTGLNASTSNLTTVDLSWNAFSDGGSPLDHYKLERVKYLVYQQNGWDLASDWSVGNVVLNGYATFNLTETTFIDDASTSIQGQPALETSVKYVYRIRAKDIVNAGYSVPQTSPVYGLTRDGSPATDPSNVIATGCDGTLNYCSNIANKGFEINITWTPSIDAGTGMNHYNVYRASSDPSNPESFIKIGEVPYTNVEFYDNDAVHVDPAMRLNDYSTYYYRITAVDNAEPPNETELLPIFDPFVNSDSGSTPDVTASSPPSNVIVTPLGLDGSNPDANIPIQNGTGVVTSATSNTFTDSTKNWTPNSLKGLNIKIVSGTGNDQTKLISSNTENTITVNYDWSTIPDGTSNYEIYTGHQRLGLSWDAAIDFKARSTDTGSGIKEYQIYRDTDPAGSFADLVGTTSNLYINDDGRADFTFYYYKVRAIDNATPGNISDKSIESGARTASSAVPTTPTSISVTTKKGDPIADSEVGHKSTITFKGSYAKNCLTNVRCLVRYEVYRSTVNYTTEEEWLSSATRLNLTLTGTRTYSSGTGGGDVIPERSDDDRDNTYTINDFNLSDATTYYYKVRSFDNTPVDPDGGPYASSLSAIATGTMNAGWNTTPDVTQPPIPAGGLQVKLKDTHPNDIELRNIITWVMLTGSDVPTRNNVNDFGKYEVWREIFNPETDELIETTKVAEKTALNENFFTDTIDINGMTGIFFTKDCKIKYYVVIVDNAATQFKYPNNTIINAYSNVSEKQYSDGSIVPSQAIPAIEGNVTVRDVAVTSAIVEWTTDQEADSIVQFRPQGSNGDWTLDGQIERTIDHTVQLKGLKPDTTYEYQIISRNYLGNNIVDAGTLPQIKTTGFNITTGDVTTTTSTADITWSTNLNASSAFVEYQLQRQPGDDPQSGTSGVTLDQLSQTPQNHRVIVKGLRSNRTYTYKIKSISTDGYVAETGFLNLKTRSYDSDQFTLEPASSNVAERNITATTAQIAWQTSTPTTSWVDFGLKSGVYDMSSGNNELVTRHIVVLEGLTPGNIYYYRVRVKDANEVEFTSQEYSFKAVLKPKISDLKVTNVTPYSVTIEWMTNIDTETILNWGKTAGYGEKRGVNELTKIHRVVINNLEDNTEYHYQIIAKDETGNEVADDDKIIRTPLDTEGPKVTDVKTDILPLGENEEYAQVIISWKTSKPATTLIQYDEGVIGGRYTKSSIEDITLSTSHTVIVKGLSPATTYHYRIVAKDRRNNKTISNDYNFLTPSREKSILQLILKSLEETFSWVGNVGQFFRNLGKKTGE